MIAQAQHEVCSALMARLVPDGAVCVKIVRLGNRRHLIEYQSICELNSQTMIDQALAHRAEEVSYVRDSSDAPWKLLDRHENRNLLFVTGWPTQEILVTHVVSHGDHAVSINGLIAKLMAAARNPGHLLQLSVAALAHFSPEAGRATRVGLRQAGELLHDLHMAECIVGEHNQYQVTQSSRWNFHLNFNEWDVIPMTPLEEEDVHG